MLLDKGASRGICLNPYAVVHIIEKKKSEIIGQINKISTAFINLVKCQPFLAKQLLQEKYFIKDKKSQENRFYTSEISSIGSSYTLNDERNREELKSNIQRKKYMKNIRKETWAGLPYPKNLYEFYDYPIMIEQIWEPENNDSDSEISNSSDEEQKEN